MSQMTLKLKIWRQPGPNRKGGMVDYTMENLEDDLSILEMLDLLNEQLLEKGERPIEFDYDCREGICGSCAMVINGVPHGHQPGVTVCQLFLRDFNDGDTLIIEPWRAKAFPMVKDLVCDRSAFDRIIAAGGYVSVNTGAAPEASTSIIPHDKAETAMDAAACIGCGACVAACKNASASLFVGAKISQFALLPQGEPERKRRARAMVRQMDAEGFGSCTNEAECQAVCPKEIKTDVIARMNREYLCASLAEMFSE